MLASNKVGPKFESKLSVTCTYWSGATLASVNQDIFRINFLIINQSEHNYFKTSLETCNIPVTKTAMLTFMKTKHKKYVISIPGDISFSSYTVLHLLLGHLSFLEFS